MNKCKCGCGGQTKTVFIHGHNSKGTKLSQSTKAKLSQSKQGILNPQWNGGKPKCEVCEKTLSNYDNKRCNVHRGPMSSSAKEKLSSARLGKGNPMYGKKLSESHRAKLSVANSDRRGTKNPNWRGTTPLNKALRELPESRELKVKVFIRDKRMCQVPGCGEKKGIEAHHIKSVSEIIYQEQIKTREDLIKCKKLFDEDNLITLCKKCHKMTKNYGSSSFKYFVDERGIIKDIVVGKSFNGMTEVTFEVGAVRANHKHPHSVQTDFVANGLLLVATGSKKHIVGPGDVITHGKNIPHAYMAIKKSRLISFFDGPRQGKDYENETIKVKPLI